MLEKDYYQELIITESLESIFKIQKIWVPKNSGYFTVCISSIGRKWNMHFTNVQAGWEGTMKGRPRKHVDSVERES